jgi:hypothetical protein
MLVGNSFGGVTTGGFAGVVAISVLGSSGSSGIGGTIGRTSFEALGAGVEVLVALA